MQLEFPKHLEGHLNYKDGERLPVQLTKLQRELIWKKLYDDDAMEISYKINME